MKKLISLFEIYLIILLSASIVYAPDDTTTEEQEIDINKPETLAGATAAQVKPLITTYADFQKVWTSGTFTDKAALWNSFNDVQRNSFWKSSGYRSDLWAASDSIQRKQMLATTVTENAAQAKTIMKDSSFVPNLAEYKDEFAKAYGLNPAKVNFGNEQITLTSDDKMRLASNGNTLAINDNIKTSNVAVVIVESKSCWSVDSRQLCGGDVVAQGGNRFKLGDAVVDMPAPTFTLTENIDLATGEQVSEINPVTASLDNGRLNVPAGASVSDLDALKGVNGDSYTVTDSRYGYKKIETSGLTTVGEKTLEFEKPWTAYTGLTARGQEIPSLELECNQETCKSKLDISNGFTEVSYDNTLIDKDGKKVPVSSLIERSVDASNNLLLNHKIISTEPGQVTARFGTDDLGDADFALSSDGKSTKTKEGSGIIDLPIAFAADMDKPVGETAITVDGTSMPVIPAIAAKFIPEGVEGLKNWQNTWTLFNEKLKSGNANDIIAYLTGSDAPEDLKGMYAVTAYSDAKTSGNTELQKELMTSGLGLSASEKDSFFLNYQVALKLLSEKEKAAGRKLTPDEIMDVVSSQDPRVKAWLLLDASEKYPELAQNERFKEEIGNVQQSIAGLGLAIIVIGAISFGVAYGASYYHRETFTKPEAFKNAQEEASKPFMRYSILPASYIGRDTLQPSTNKGASITDQGFDINSPINSKDYVVVKVTQTNGQPFTVNIDGNSVPLDYLAIKKSEYGTDFGKLGLELSVAASNGDLTNYFSNLAKTEKVSFAWDDESSSVKTTAEGRNVIPFWQKQAKLSDGSTKPLTTDIKFREQDPRTGEWTDHTKTVPQLSSMPS